MRSSPFLRPFTVLAVLILLPAAACDRPAPRTPGSSLARSEQTAALKALEQAPTQGFRRGMFGETGLVERLKQGDPAVPAQIRRALIAYAEALHGHAIPAKAFAPDWGLKPAPYDAAAGLDQALAQGRLQDWLQGLPPQTDRYRALQAGYLAYARLMAAGGWRSLPEGGALKPGAAGPGVAALRARLAAEDPSLAAPARAAPPADGYDATVEAAVKRAQVRYGLKPTGVLDQALRSELNVPVETRVAQIRASLERLRWLPREVAPTRIEVNTAAGLFDLYEDGQPALHMLAVAGKPGDESPILHSAVETVVLNPEWRIPDSIADDEILPKAAADPGYLARHHYVRNDGPGVKLIQRPGPDNALGEVKFLFPNPYSVYLHDTPSQAAFSRSRRSVSHGCVRLQHPLQLARLLLSQEKGWSAERVDATLKQGDTTAVSLSRKVPVTLNYLTAFPSADGSIAFRPDVYGWDAELLRLLDAGAPRKA